MFQRSIYGMEWFRNWNQSLIESPKPEIGRCNEVSSEDHNFKQQTIIPRDCRFTYEDIKTITNNFKRVIGKGGVGTVYYGCLRDGIEVAVHVYSNLTYFIGGFGTVAWVDVKEYETIKPDKIAAESGDQNLKELNAMFSKKLKDILSTKVEIDDAAFISVDSKGTDVRVRQGAQFSIRRISFEAEREIQSLDDAKAALVMIIKRHRKSKSSTE
ncbi:hypothetical protein ZIOFF_017163 [Zingiber officinale]|uniref:Uncharacterized protein n=1 Tax=Zingiber officinale TaxID=94328 RepID=A0A8J5HRH3_ZINOF|nr:hypothetical protein ZIOFF_017163 [Zingiber officinale]